MSVQQVREEKLAEIQSRQGHLAELLGIVRAGACARVLGPRFRYKSKLMRTAAKTLREAGSHHSAFLKLSDVIADSESAFFSALYQKVVEALPGALAADPFTLRSQLATPQMGALDFQYGLLALLERGERNVALFLDDLEMAPPNLVALLLGTLRTVFTMRVDEPDVRFQAVVGGSLSLSQVALDNVSRFESVSRLVLVGDLDEAEQVALVRALCGRGGIVAQPGAISGLVAQANGDPFLIEELLKIAGAQLRRQGRSMLTAEMVVEAANLFLDRAHYMVVSDVLRHIESDPDLLACTLLLMGAGRPLSSNALPVDLSKSPTPLDLCGAFRRQGDSYRIKGGLWEQILHAHLTPLRAGGLFAIAGEWTKAIEYLGRASQLEQRGERAELQATTINAIHASENADQAFRYLALGLQALYPDNSFMLYQRKEGALRQVGGFGLQEQRLILLEEEDGPDAAALIEAFYGPEYSRVAIGGASRLLFPLRVGPMGATEPLGMAVLSPIASHSQFELRDEITQLSGFLRQVARAIDEKIQFAEMLEATTRRAERLNALNGVLTMILHHRTEAADAILRVALEGITHGLGLGFNRAIYLEWRSEPEALVGKLGVGQLTRREAEREWELHPHDQVTVETWLADLFDNPEERARRHRRLQAVVEKIEVPLTSEHESVLATCFREREALQGSPLNRLVGFPPAFVKEIDPPRQFALVPLDAGEHVLGVLYVDDKFTGERITAERFELLQAFASQAALIIENARAFAAEQAQRERLQALQLQHTTFVTGAVHELSKAVANIPDLVSEIKVKLPEGRDIRPALADLERSAEGSRQIMGRLRDFTLPRLQMRRLDLGQLVEEMVAELRTACPAHVSLHFRRADREMMLMGDQVWLEMLLRNLLQNGWEAIPADRTGQVAVTLGATADTLTLQVTDDGTGISPAALDHIFESGFSTKPKGDLFRGMGLPYCREVAEAHEGTLTAKSTEGEGTTFILSLPRRTGARRQ